MNSTSKKQRLLLISLLLAVCLAVFINTFANDFIWDDPYLISENRHIKNHNNIPLFFTPRYWNELHPYSNFQAQYRPVRTTTFALDYYFWKLNPAGYHLTNLLLHMANVALIFYLVSAIGNGQAVNHQRANGYSRLLMGLPFLTAVFFATHPIHTESVTYIKNRSDLLAFLFFLSAFLLFIKVKASAKRTPRLLLMIGSLLCFTLAVLSKEMALTLPAVLVLYTICFQDKTARAGALIRIIPFCVIIVLYFWFMKTMLILHNPGLPQGEFRIGAGHHLLAIVKTIGAYLALLVFPLGLNADRAFSVPASALETPVIISLAALLLIGLITVRAWSRSKIVVFSLVYVLLTLLPAANIVFLWSRPIAEQRLYIPSFGFCLILAWVINRIYHYEANKNSGQAGIAGSWLLAGIIVLGFACQTIYRNFEWRDPITFYTLAIKRNPHSAKMHNGLAIAMSEQGRREEAIAHYETAMKLDPSYSYAYNNMGAELSEMGRLDEAVLCYEEALRLNPWYLAAHSNLGLTLLQQGSIEAAVSHFKAAVKLKPDTDRLNDLGSAYATAGRLEEAIDCYLAALRIEPDFALSLSNLGAAITKTENIEEAAGRFLPPMFSPWQLARIYNGAAAIYLEKGDLGSAKKYFLKAVQLDPDYTDGLYNLGLALARGKEYSEAADVYSRLLAIDPDEKIALERHAYCLRMMITEPE